MASFDEERQRFTFDDQLWIVVKYDECADYLKKIAKLPETKGVDFIGRLRQADGILYWIEAKDFRGYRIQNKRRLSDGELAIEVAQKLRDSIAGVVGAYRMSEAWRDWRPFIEAMSRKKCPLHVVLWLEQDPMPSPRARRLNAEQVLAMELKKRLRWLTTKAFVVSKAFGRCPPGLVVVDLPGAGQAT